MKKYGYLPCYPIICYRDEKKRLKVKDGQHRLMIAESLGLPVYYLVLDPGQVCSPPITDDGRVDYDLVDYDVAEVAAAQGPWTTKDYARTFAGQGLKAYQEVIDFAEQYGLSLGVAAALLAGLTDYANVRHAFIARLFRVKDRKWAEVVASLWSQLGALAPSIKRTPFLGACMAVCRVEEFDTGRMLENARRCREKLLPYSTRDAYLDMMENVYNYGRVKLLGLKSAAIMSMRDRNVSVTKTKQKKKEKSDEDKQAK